jgi:hypothetical protein
MFGYDKDKEKKIKILCEQALNLSKSHSDPHIVWVNFVFVSYWNKDDENMASDFLSDSFIIFY